MVPERLRVKHTAHSTEVVPRAVLLHFCMHMVVLKYSYILEKNANLLISSQILSHRYPSHHLVTLAPSPHHSYYPDTSSINILITLFTSSLPHYYPHHLIITLIPHHYPYHLTITSSPHHYLHSGSFSLHKCSQTHHITINIVARSKKKKKASTTQYILHQTMEICNMRVTPADMLKAAEKKAFTRSFHDAS